MRLLAQEQRGESVAPRNLHFVYADALRAAAIFAVVLHHVVYLTKPTIGNHRPYELGYLGVWGVNCFFVLSGYLLGRPYIAALIDPKYKFPTLKSFYYRRFLRIYPAYAVAIVFSIIAFVISYHVLPSALDVLSHLLVLQTLDERFATSLNGPLWTMSVDLEFYLVLPLCAALLSRAVAGFGRRERIYSVIGALSFLVVGSLIFRFFVLFTIPSTALDFSASIVFERNVVGFAGTFALGMFLALIAILYGDRIPRRPWLFASLILVGLVIAGLQLGIRMDVPVAGPPSISRIVRLAFSEQLAAISVSLIFFGLSEGRLPFITRATDSKLVASAAALAYTVYLVHWPIIDAFSLFLHRPNGLKAFLEVGALSVVVVVFVAYVLHVAVERPMLAMKKRVRDSP